MSSKGISVVIPVGPNPAYLEWLPEAIESVQQQTVKPSEIFIVLDGDFDFSVADYLSEAYYYGNLPTNVRYYVTDAYFVEDHIIYGFYRTPVRLGVASVFNVAVKLASNNCVFMMGSDDKLLPTCLEECWKAYIDNYEQDAWYNVTIVTQSGEEAWIANHAAMVTKGLFEWFERGNGYFGFPPSAGCGGPDALLLSILMKHAPDKIVQVKQGEPLYWVREHEHQMTKQDASFFIEEMVSIRNKETERFEVPNG